MGPTCGCCKPICWHLYPAGSNGCFGRNTQHLVHNGARTVARDACIVWSGWLVSHNGSTDWCGLQFSSLPGQVGRPVVHEPTPALEQVLAPIGRLDDLARIIRLLSRPVPEARAKPVRHGRDLVLPEHPAQLLFSTLCLRTRNEESVYRLTYGENRVKERNRPGFLILTDAHFRYHDSRMPRFSGTYDAKKGLRPWHRTGCIQRPSRPFHT